MYCFARASKPLNLVPITTCKLLEQSNFCPHTPTITWQQCFPSTRTAGQTPWQGSLFNWKLHNLHLLNYKLYYFTYAPEMLFFFSFSHTPTTAQQLALYLLQLLLTTLHHLRFSYLCITPLLNLHHSFPAPITSHRPAAASNQIKQNPTGGESHHSMQPWRLTSCSARHHLPRRGVLGWMCGVCMRSCVWRRRQCDGARN